MNEIQPQPTSHTAHWQIVSKILSTTCATNLALLKWPRGLLVLGGPTFGVCSHIHFFPGMTKQKTLHARGQKHAAHTVDSIKLQAIMLPRLNACLTIHV